MIQKNGKEKQGVSNFKRRRVICPYLVGIRKDQYSLNITRFYKSCMDLLYTPMENSMEKNLAKTKANHLADPKVHRMEYQKERLRNIQLVKCKDQHTKKQIRNNHITIHRQS